MFVSQILKFKLSELILEIMQTKSICLTDKSVILVTGLSFLFKKF